MEKLFSCRTAADRYGYSEAFFRKYLSLRKISSIKIGHNRRMRQSDIEIFLKSRGIQEVEKHTKLTPAVREKVQ